VKQKEGNQEEVEQRVEIRTEMQGVVSIGSLGRDRLMYVY
jgi:hypothetical protein